MKKFFCLILILFSLSFFLQTIAFAQPKRVNEQIENLIKRDSLNELIITELKNELTKYKTPVATLSDSSSDNSSIASSTDMPPVENRVIQKFKERGLSEDTSLIIYLIFAFVSGLFSLVTPCVFPMIPLTVTFFTNASISRGQAIRKAIIYGASIVLIFTVLGLLFGAALANLISTHWLPNILFFVLFLFFGLSFLGLFEITLPSSFVNRIDRQADKGGYYGVFFMAFTLVLISFSCTVPIVGAVGAVSGGESLRPILGMLAYSTAFSIPFVLFAMFPSWMNALPKSGGWLNIIKVFLGFLEIGFAFKFLSVADQVYHWNILDREIYIAIWIVIAILLGVYFLGKIRLPHDSETHITTVPRLMLSIICFVFAVYLFPGMFGAPLKAFSGYLPPMSTHDFDVPGIIREYSAASCGSTNKTICEEPKYSKGLKLPHGLKGYFDYKQALKCARERKLPLFIDFTGHGCVNCREMETNVWSDPEVLKILNNDYVIVALYSDDRTQLPKSEWYESPYDHKMKKTLGAVNSDFQLKFNTNAQPFYVLLDPFTELPLAKPEAYNLSVPNYIDFLEEGKANFINSNKRK